jgi:hypothetical protein
MAARRSHQGQDLAQAPGSHPGVVQRLDVVFDGGGQVTIEGAGAAYERALNRQQAHGRQNESARRVMQSGTVETVYGNMTAFGSSP